MQLNHLHLKAHNLDATRVFYEKYFGFRKAFDHENAAFLCDDSGFLLAIFAYKGDEPAFEFPDWFHFGFCLSKESAVRELFAQMRSDQVEFARPLKEFRDGTVNFYCFDPAGHKVEVSWNAVEVQQLKPLASNNHKSSVSQP